MGAFGEINNAFEFKDVSAFYDKLCRSNPVFTLNC